MRPELKLGLYLVTDERLSRGRATAELVRAAIRGGIDAVQLRGKDLPVREQLAIGRELRAITREAGVLFIVNDRVDLALALDADGVHVGQDDLPAEVVRQLVGPEMIIGVSAATIPEALAARAAGADYLGVGAIYGTATKLDAGAATGTALLGTIAGAVVSAIVAAADPEAAARDLQRRIAAALRRVDER